MSLCFFFFFFFMRRLSHSPVEELTPRPPPLRVTGVEGSNVVKLTGYPMSITK